MSIIPGEFSKTSHKLDWPGICDRIRIRLECQ